MVRTFAVELRSHLDARAGPMCQTTSAAIPWKSTFARTPTLGAGAGVQARCPSP